MQVERGVGRRLGRLAGRVSARLSQGAMIGLLLTAFTIPAMQQRTAGAATGAAPAAERSTAGQIAVRRVESREIAVKPASRLAADKPLPAAAVPPAARPAEAKPVETKAAESKPAEAKPPERPPESKPLPVPPASAPAEPQPDAWPAAEVAEASALCDATLKALTLTASREPPLRNGVCGTPAPLSIRRIGATSVELQPAAVVNCRYAVALDKWIAETLQPAARAEFASPVSRILVASSYTCRNRYGQATGTISEHAFANALDISGFVLADGRVVKVVDGWGPTARDAPQPAADQAKAAEPKPAATAEKKPKRGQAVAAPLPVPVSATAQPGGDAGRFLRGLHKGACGVFGTVLGPEANEAHRDHLHLDLKTRTRTALCE